MIAKLNLKDKKILFVGGGKIALEKARKFLAQDLNITILAPSIEIELASLSKDNIYAAYDKKYLHDFDFIYACTDDKLLNQQIVVDANSLNKLSASVNRDDNCVYHGVKSENYDNFELGIYSNGSYPYITNCILEDIRSLLDSKYIDRIELLAELRRHVLSLKINQEEKKYLLKDLAFASKVELKFYLQAIKEKSNILVFHGTNLDKYDYLVDYCHKIPNTYFCYLNPKVCQSYNEKVVFTNSKRIIDLEHLLKNIKLLKTKEVNYIPMLLEKGYYFNKLENILQIKLDPILNKEVLKKVLDKWNDDNIIIALHNTKKNEIAQLIKEINSNIIILKIYDEMCENIIEQEKVMDLIGNQHFYVYSLFMLEGSHYHRDLISFVAKHNNLELVKSSLIEDIEIDNIIFKN